LDVEPTTNGENNQEASPFLPLATASQKTKGEREELFFKWFRSEKVKASNTLSSLQDALAALDKHEEEVRKFLHDEEEQALADWTATALNYQDEFLMPLRLRQSPTGNCFVSFYRSEWEEFSPAEGGCYWMRRQMVACFPVSHFNGVGAYGHPDDGEADARTLEAAKEASPPNSWARRAVFTAVGAPAARIREALASLLKPKR
jgi:predicted house-cleaning noncanonical NTP pyrophosphatase (MazG superfamily)